MPKPRIKHLSFTAFVPQMFTRHSRLVMSAVVESYFNVFYNVLWSSTSCYLMTLLTAAGHLLVVVRGRFLQKNTGGKKKKIPGLQTLNFKPWKSWDIIFFKPCNQLEHFFHPQISLCQEKRRAEKRTRKRNRKGRRREGREQGKGEEGGVEGKSRGRGS